MNKVFSALMMALVFASCQNSDDSETTDVVTTDTVSLTAPVAASADSGPKGITAAPATMSAPATVATMDAGTGNGGLNPAHGAPGHRCDIAVGAPLNSAPGNPPVQGSVNGAPAPALQQGMPPQPAPASSNGNVKLNPAHGEPGHDCKIPVGQPLKS